MNVNSQLRALYESKLPTLIDSLKKENVFDDISWPLLLSVWDDTPVRPKVMIFGQETNGWGDIDGNDLTEELMGEYRKFNMGSTYRLSPFWRYFHEICERLHIGSHEAVWNNINKIGKSDGAGRPAYKTTAIENDAFNVLRDELQILRPERCIFLTGPRYDADIKEKLPDVEFLAIGDYLLNEFAKLKSEYLPERSYRTYHPGYGGRYAEWYGKVLDIATQM